MKEKTITIGIFELSVESDKVRIKLDQKKETKTTDNKTKKKNK